MAEESQIFHESWYRIAGQSLALRSSVRVRRQMFRGALWYVLFDPFGDQFYRLRPAAYRFVARLGERRTVEEVWKESIAVDPDNAPGQEEVIQLLAQLYHANLLHYELAPDSAKLFERYRETKQKIRRAALANIMFFRLPLFDPDAALKRSLFLVRPLMGPLGAVLWLAVVGLGVKAAIDNFAGLSNQSQGILALPNIPLLYLGLVIIKALHELGHAFVVRGFGGEVHSMGVMFLIFNPLPYVDATAAWAFRSKGRRVLVGAAGMIVELFVAAFAVLVWAGTGPGVLHSLAYNMVFVASVSTILFNINPLLRFDGYYILSDLLDIPNLHTQASQHLRHLVERYAFGWQEVPQPGRDARTRRSGSPSSAWPAASTGWWSSPRSCSSSPIASSCSASSWPRSAPSPGSSRRLCASSATWRPTPGSSARGCGRSWCACWRLRQPAACSTSRRFPPASARPGSSRRTSTPTWSIGSKGASPRSSRPQAPAWSGAGRSCASATRRSTLRSARWTGASTKSRPWNRRPSRRSQADLKAVQSLRGSMLQRRERLREEKADLLVRAEIAGIWVAPGVEDLVGMWLRRGTPVGQLVDDSGFRFAAVVSQDDVSQVFTGNILGSEVRLAGEAHVNILATERPGDPHGTEAAAVEGPRLWRRGRDRRRHPRGQRCRRRAAFLRGAGRDPVGLRRGPPSWTLGKGPLPAQPRAAAAAVVPAPAAARAVALPAVAGRRP